MLLQMRVMLLKQGTHAGDFAPGVVSFWLGTAMVHLFDEA